MSTQVGIGKSIHRNPKIAASEAVEMALETGAIEKTEFVFMFSSVEVELGGSRPRGGQIDPGQIKCR
jgi:hypothetical protein